MYVVCTEIGTIRKIKVEVEDKDIKYRYVVQCNTGQYKRDDSTLFGTKEMAEEYCLKMNKPKKKILLKDIVIDRDFKCTKPNTEKIKAKIDYYNKNCKFYTKIVINKQNLLIDGYITYMIAKMYGKELIECWVEDKELA